MLLGCQRSLKICGTHGEENSKSHVFSRLVSCAFSVSLFAQARRVCDKSSLLVTLGGDKICLLSSKLGPAANGSYKNSKSSPSFPFCSTDYFQSYSYSSGNEDVFATFGPFHSSRRRRQSTATCFSAFDIACYSAECITPTKSLVK